jgi:hypothetical protein
MQWHDCSADGLGCFMMFRTRGDMGDGEDGRNGSNENDFGRSHGCSLCCFVRPALDSGRLSSVPLHDRCQSPLAVTGAFLALFQEVSCVILWSLAHLALRPAIGTGGAGAGVCVPNPIQCWGALNPVLGSPRNPPDAVGPWDCWVNSRIGRSMWNSPTGIRFPTSELPNRPLA